MRRLALVLVLLVAVTVAVHAFQTPQTGDLRPTVILVAFDGWRWDYHSKAPAPNLRSVMARGVRAEGLIPSYPSKTFPNFYTIATGLYPGHHGIVANNIKDPASGRLFTLAKPQEVGDAMWYGGEPIWVTAQRAGQTVGAMYWPGTEAPIDGRYPRYWRRYNEGLAGNARVDQLLEWLDLPSAERPTLLTVYFEDTDTAGHDDGPDSRAVHDAITRADAYLGRLLRGLEQRSLLDRVNLIVLSDHGMAAVNNRRVVLVDDYISLNDVEVVDINPTLGLIPNPGKEDAVFRALATAHPRLKVYRRDETPERWHYRDHPRIPPIVGVVDEGWQLIRRSSLRDMLAGRLRGAGGSHGYNPTTAMSMRGVFVAAGPAFKRGVTVEAFENIHIYNALAQILGVTPASNDGDPALARALLQ